MDRVEDVVGVGSGEEVGCLCSGRAGEEGGQSEEEEMRLHLDSPGCCRFSLAIVGMGLNVRGLTEVGKAILSISHQQRWRYRRRQVGTRRVTDVGRTIDRTIF